MRWIVQLAQYEFDQYHKKGTSNVVPNTLSRAIPSTELFAKGEMIRSAKDINSLEPTVASPSFTLVELYEENMENSSVHIINFIVQPEDSWYVKMLSKVALSPIRFKDWSIRDGLLYFLYKDAKTLEPENSLRWRLVVPESARLEALYECHDDPRSGHVGITKSRHRAMDRYYWAGIAKDIEQYVKACTICKEAKSPYTRQAGMMGKFKNTMRPFQMVAIDLIGPLPRSTKGNSHILVITDWVTKPYSFYITHIHFKRYRGEKNKRKQCLLVTLLSFGAPRRRM